jgi:N-acetylmuramic acid 6-phosphate etherase
MGDTVNAKNIKNSVKNGDNFRLSSTESTDAMSEILKLLNLTPSPQSIDYVENKKQFHLFNLLTEQRHAKTWNLSFTIQSNVEAGLRMLFSVDEDISHRIMELVKDPLTLEQMVQAVVEAAQQGRRIYVYGCGATGRLAKQMESSFWRPFWEKVKRHSCWETLQKHLPADIEEHLTGEMTGADRALVSSLEGFEDLQLIGKLQLHDHKIQRGDVVICVTEGGETSSVIGTILAALEQYGELDSSRQGDVRRHLYFIYNNPDDALRPFTRSASVLDNPAITKINLTTGPQAITGSTRLQATTSETFVLGMVLEEAIGRILRQHLMPCAAAELGYGQNHTLAERLGTFEAVKAAVDAAVPATARFTELEADTYRHARFSTYFAKKALITVFIDSTERSPTFRLYPLDKVQDRERHCWVQVWTEACDFREAWRNFLGRPFRGLDPWFYREPFQGQVLDPYLREAALRSLANAGNDQENSYDFSFSGSNVEIKGPQPGDLGVVVLLDEEVEELLASGSAFHRFISLVHERGARLAVILAGDAADGDAQTNITRLLGIGDVAIRVGPPELEDPLTVRRQIALKMLLNAHSTGIMAALGRVIGNTMTSVSPSNLKLIGRATYLILTHVNDILRQPEWIAAHGLMEPLSFSEANAILMDAMDYVHSRASGQTAEVALSIIRIIEALDRRSAVSWEEAQRVLDEEGLAPFLVRHRD